MIRVYFQWWDSEEYEVDFIDLKFDSADSSPGSFRITLDIEWINVIIPGSKVRIEYNTTTVWRGRLGLMTDNTDGTFSIDGTDSWGVLFDRIIRFKGAGFIDDVHDRLEEVEASAMLKRLFKSYTGTTADDSAFDITKYVIPSITSKNWTFDNVSLGSAVKSLAQSASVSTQNIGFACWIDGDDNVHYAPKGSGKRHVDKIYNANSLQLDPDRVRNKVMFRGGYPSTIPSDRDYYTESSNVTAGATPGTHHWVVGSNSTGTFILSRVTSSDSDEPKVQQGEACIRMNVDLDAPASGYAWGQIYLDIDRLRATLTDEIPPTDFSDGKGSLVTNAVRRDIEQEDSSVYTDRTRGNFVIDYIEFYMRWTEDASGKTPVTWDFATGALPPIIQTWLCTDGAVKYKDPNSLPMPTDWVECEELSGNIYNTGMQWKRTRWYPKPTSTVLADADATDVDAIIIGIKQTNAIPDYNPGTTSPTAYLWIDGLVIHLQEVECVELNTSSIIRWGIREFNVQNRNITDWKTGVAVTKGILANLQEPGRSASVITPYDASVQINDVIQVRYANKVWPLVVNKVSVSADVNGMSMVVDVGDERPTIEGVINVFRVITNEQQTGGSGYKLAKTFENNRCYTLCEVECELECLLDLNQTETGLLSDEGVDRSDPCQIDCQTMVEL